MDVLSIRPWQWMIIGLVAGAAVGYAWTGMPREVKRSNDPRLFNTAVRTAAFREKMKLPQQIRNITVLEPETDPSNTLIYPVEFDYAQIQRMGNRVRGNANAAAPTNNVNAEPQWERASIYAKTPFEGDLNIKQYLEKYKMPYTDRTGAAAMMPVYYGAGGGALVLGVLWPVTLAGLVKVGLAKAPPPREKKVKDKKRGPEVEDEMLVKAGDRRANAGDIAQLDALNAQMEADIGKGLAPGSARVATAANGEPVSVLMTQGATTAASESGAQAAAAEQEKKDYKGEFYPVVRPGGKPQ